MEEVNVPEWGGSVFVRVLSGTERDAYEADIFANKENRLENMRAKLVVRTVCDENGSLLLKPDDVARIGADSWVALDRIMKVAQRINRLTDSALEEIKGNSEPSPGDAR